MPGIKCILILSLIVSIVLMMVEESLTADLSEEFKNNPVLFEQYEGSFCTYYLDNGCPLILKPAVAIARIGLDVELNSAKDLFLFLSTAMFFQGLVYVLVVLFLISLLVYLIRIFVNKREIQKLEDIVSDAIDERSEIIRRIQNYICYVPPSYRTSEALAYFVHAYGNTKVNNLKEAVNSYSDAVGTESIKRAISNMCRELDGIQTVQLRTSEQIYSMNADIWREDYNF